MKGGRLGRGLTQRRWGADRSFTWVVLKRRKAEMKMTVGTMTNLTSLDLATEMEAEAEINAIMSSHRMHGMRHVEAPAAAALDSRVLAGLKRSIGRKAGMHIMTDNGMMKIVLPRKKRTVTAIVMTIRGMVEDGRKFAEVVD